MCHFHSIFTFCLVIPTPPPHYPSSLPPSHTPICNMLSFFYGNSPAIQENTRLKPLYASEVVMRWPARQPARISQIFCHILKLPDFRHATLEGFQLSFYEDFFSLLFLSNLLIFPNVQSHFPILHVLLYVFFPVVYLAACLSIRLFSSVILSIHPSRQL
jgi:hypothetical protein